MSKRKTSWLLQVFLVSLALSARGNIQPGASFDQLVREMGYGASSMRIGTTEVLIYKNGTRVRVEKGIVTEITQRGQVGVTSVIRYKSPTVLNLNQKLAAGDQELQDRSDHRQALHQGGKTPVRIVQDEVRGAVLEFSQDAYLRVTQPADLDLNQGLTLCAWLKPSDFNEQSPVLGWEKDGVHFWLNVKGYQWEDKPAGVNWCIKGDGSEDVVSTTNPPTGQWTHVAVSFNTGKKQGTLFFNGVRVAEKQLPAGTPRVEGDITIGGQPSISDEAKFHGLMDDIRVVLRPMDERDIRQIMGLPPINVAKNSVSAVPPLPTNSPAGTQITESPAPAQKSDQRTVVAIPGKSQGKNPPPVKSTLGRLSAILAHIQQIATRMMIPLLVIVALGYVFICYCYKRICEKAGQPPGAMIWIPVAQFIPLLRVAGMAGWMLILLLIPLMNVVVMLILWARIATALNKSAWLAASLLVPMVNLGFIPYLAFSRTARAEVEPNESMKPGLKTVTTE